jgi:hypothetical protein
MKLRSRKADRQAELCIQARADPGLQVITDSRIGCSPKDTKLWGNTPGLPYPNEIAHSHKCLILLSCTLLTVVDNQVAMTKVR